MAPELVAGASTGHAVSPSKARSARGAVRCWRCMRLKRAAKATPLQLRGCAFQQQHANVECTIQA
jgi:hypothetical protein